MSHSLFRDNQRATALEYPFRKRARLPPGGIQVHPGHLRGRGDLPRFVVAHLVKEMNRFFLDLQDAGPDRNHIPCVQFLLVRDVLLDGGHSAPLRLQKGWGQGERGKKLPCGFVELPDVPHDVHVSHVIAMPRVDNAAICDRKIGQDCTSVSVYSENIPIPKTCGAIHMDIRKTFSKRSATCRKSSTLEYPSMAAERNASSISYSERSE